MLSEQLVADLINPGNTNIIPGLERIQQVLVLLDNPQYKYKVIHITGTNGKGSTAAFLENGLVHAGFTVGKFTSPYIHVINECICLNHNPITDSLLETTYLKIKHLLSKHLLSLSPFEFLTVIMFEYFASQKINWLVLEVGMGGLNDATNVVESSYAIITNVSLDHCQWLGNTVGEIAREKAGIIKYGKTILGTDDAEVVQVVRDKTRNYLNIVDQYKPQVRLDTTNFTTLVNFTDAGIVKQYHLSLFGIFQAYNFLCAYAVFRDLGITELSINHSAKKTFWPGRLQIVSTNPIIMFDATHNTDGAKNLWSTLKDIYTQDQVVIVTSILKDKDIRGMLTYFSQLSNSVIYTSLENNPRGIEASVLAAYGDSLFKDKQIINDPHQALQAGLQLKKKLVLVTGSTYLLSILDLRWLIKHLI